MEMEVETVDNERLRMERRFQKHAVSTDESQPEDPVTAPIVDFAVTDLDLVNALQVRLFLHTGDDVVEHEFHHSIGEPNEVIRELLSETDDNELGQVIGSDLYLEPTEDDRWVNPDHDILFQSAQLPEDSVDRRIESEKLFQDRDARYRASERARQERETKGTGKIVDYKVRESSSEITQDLEIDLKFYLPNDESGWYKFIHDQEHPHEPFERLRSLNDNPDKVYELVGTEVPVIWDDERRVWMMKIPRPFDGITGWLANHGVLDKFTNSLRPIEKTYKHADE